MVERTGQLTKGELTLRRQPETFGPACLRLVQTRYVVIGFSREERTLSGCVPAYVGVARVERVRQTCKDGLFRRRLSLASVGSCSQMRKNMDRGGMIRAVGPPQGADGQVVGLSAGRGHVKVTNRTWQCRQRLRVGASKGNHSVLLHFLAVSTTATALPRPSWPGPRKDRWQKLSNIHIVTAEEFFRVRLGKLDNSWSEMGSDVVAFVPEDLLSGRHCRILLYFGLGEIFWFRLLAEALREPVLQVH
jgi:hypothetical protein